MFNEVNIEGQVGGIKNLFLLYQFNIYPNFFLFHQPPEGITLQTFSLSYQNQVIPQVYNSNRISHKDAFKMITKGSKLQRNNIPGLTYHPDQEAPTGCCDFLKNTAAILSLGANDGSTVYRFARKRWTARLLFELADRLRHVNNSSLQVRHPNLRVLEAFSGANLRSRHYCDYVFVNSSFCL